MATCSRCNATLAEGAQFCAACGTSQTAAGTPASAAAPGAPGLTPNVAGGLSYVLGFITGIIFLVLDPYKNDKFVRFHAFQSIFFNVAMFVVWIVLVVLTMVASMLWGGLGLIMWMVSMLVWLGSLVVWILMMVKAFQNGRLELPVIGPLARSQAG